MEGMNVVNASYKEEKQRCLICSMSLQSILSCRVRMVEFSFFLVDLRMFGCLAIPISSFLLSWTSDFVDLSFRVGVSIQL